MDKAERHFVVDGWCDSGVCARQKRSQKEKTISHDSAARPNSWQPAIQALSHRLTGVAAWYGKSPSEPARLLRRDQSLWVSRNGHLLYVCELEVPLEAEEADEARNSAVSSV